MAVTSVQEALNILNGLVSTQKVENEGINDQGKLSSEEWNAVVVVVNSLLKLGGHTNVADAVNSNEASSNQVLYRAAGEREWRIISVDSVPTRGSDNPVASGGVYIRLDAIAQTISELADDIAYIGEDDGEGGVPTGGGGTPVDLTDYALKTWVAQNFLGKASMDTTPTANSTNPVTSAGVKEYVDSHGGGGGGDNPSVFTFNITVEFPDAGSPICNFGTIKFSDIVAAAEDYDIVKIVATDVGSDTPLTVSIAFYLDILMLPDIYVFNGQFSSRFYTLAITEGSNDTVNSSVGYSDIEQQVQADWSESNTSRKSYIRNKPTVPKISTFTVTSSSSGDVTTYNFGTTKFSDISNATQTSDDVFLVVDGVRFRYIMTVNNGLLFSASYYFGNGGIISLALTEGADDAISATDGYVTVPVNLSDLTADATHRTVTDAEKTTWNSKANIAVFNVTSSTSGGVTTYNWGTTKFSDITSAISNNSTVLLDIDNHVLVLRHTTTVTDNGVSAYVFAGIFHLLQPAVVAVVLGEGSNDSIEVTSITKGFYNADWGETDIHSQAYIQNKPDIPAAAVNGGAALKAAGIPFGRVDSTSTATAFTATVDGITELRDGVCVLLENGVVTSAAGFTLNINNLGAKPSFNNMTAATRDTTIFNVNYTMLFVYDAARVVDGITGAWCCYRGYDGNTNTIGYQVRTNSSTLPVSDQTGRYRLLFTSADGSKYVPATTSTSTNATSSRAVNQRPIDPHGAIVYYSSTTVLSANGNVGTSSQWQQYTLTLGYSFNRTGAALVLSYPKPVYVKCTPQTDGSAIIDADTPYVQALPTTADGKIYIHLGRAYSATAIELTLDHPVYHYYNGAIRRWLGPV